MEKIIHISELAQLRERLTGKIVLVGGCFDLVHPAHLALLEEAADLGTLVVGVLSDSFIKSYKGPGRPILNEKYRRKMVSAFECVHAAFIAESGVTNQQVLQTLKPDILVLSSEKISTERMTRRMEVLEKFPGLEVHYTQRRVHLPSTSEIIEKILNSK